MSLYNLSILEPPLADFRHFGRWVSIGPSVNQGSHDAEVEEQSQM